MPPAAVRRPTPPGTEDGVVLAVRATGQERLRAALRAVAAEPELLGLLRRIVVVDTAATPSSTLLREAVRLPAGLLHLVRRPAVPAPEALSLGVLAALDEVASDVLLLDDAALLDPAALVTAIARRSAATAVIGLRDPRAAAAGPVSWWGALLPLEAVRAVGAALPEAGEVALADLVLRAETAGFRWAALDAAGPVPTDRETDRLLLALLHGTGGAVAALRDGIAGDLRLLLRPAALRERRSAVRELLAGLGEERRALPRLRLALAWSALQRRARAGALERSSESAWAERLGGDRVNRGWPRAEREAADERPAAVRLPAWPTTRRTSAA
ncbi:hypothetical protein [Amnibacterium kyonggiense]|uniref:Glycosyl transferase family 2 n=1 Tax=Amnibacterium kyonggiense TaxID=595671 RepID=A0A4R7FR03_9MICO|nr:hypothetical protein [Amnibacterium kyonggiense]TDS80230.1 hypothetical protein CLV52_0785 [Amnibacterium kyonggiense]